MEKTIMISTHIMQEVEAICDRVIIIDKGNIVADDTLDNLRQSSKGDTVVRVQFVTDIDESALAKIAGLKSSIKLDTYTWKLIGNNEQFRQTVSQFALTHNYEVAELVSEKNSLEDIFRKLTSHVGDL
jgi:ABC-2 type transport system ATP-binding protein